MGLWMKQMIWFQSFLSPDINRKVKVAVDGASAIAASETYTYTLTTANTVALVFTANDTMVDSTETFTVNLTGNTVPVRKTDVEATADATVTVNTPFVLDLAEIFEDADGNPLTYNVSVNGSAAISAIPAYTYTPGVEGAMTLVFSANDGLADSTDTYTVKLTVSGSSYNNGNGGKGGGGSIPLTPEYRVTITGSVGTTLAVEIDEATGRASIAIGALAERIFVDDGATVVAVPAIPGVKLYKLEVPAESLSNSNGAGELIFATDAGTIAIPADMLKGMTGTEGKTAGITIGPGDKTGVEWARQSIEVMASKGIINGTVAGAYSPAARITRADYLVLLVKTLGLTAKFEGNFADAEPNACYYEALGVAKQLGLAAGTGHDEFHPLENISRQDMMVLTARALEKAKQLKASGDPAILASFSDKEDISA